VLFLFATLNLLFMQMVLAGLERWLAQRRTREIMGARGFFAGFIVIFHTVIIQDHSLRDKSQKPHAAGA